MIAGEFRSRLIQSVPGLEVRPTPDRLRETLFNILMPELARSFFVDAYAGSGSVGIEALSRGAARAIFIEKSKPALEVLEENLKTLKIAERAQILRGAVRKKLTADIGDIIFLDPPYPLAEEYELVMESLGKEEGRMRLAIAQHSWRTKLQTQYGLLERYREVKQGENMLSFFRWRPGQPISPEAATPLAPPLHNPES